MLESENEFLARLWQRSSVWVCVALLLFVASGCVLNTERNYENGRKAFNEGKYQEAIKLLERGGEDGKELLGIIYYRGLGVPQDENKAKEYLFNAPLGGEGHFCKADLELIEMSRADEFSYKWKLREILNSYKTAQELGFSGNGIAERIEILEKIIQKMQEESFRKYSVSGGGTFWGYEGYPPEGWGIRKIRTYLGEHYITLGFWKNGLPQGDVLQGYWGGGGWTGTNIGIPLGNSY